MNRTYIEGLKLCRKIARASAFQPYLVSSDPVKDPIEDPLESEAYLQKYVRANVLTVYHPVMYFFVYI